MAVMPRAWISSLNACQPTGPNSHLEITGGGAMCTFTDKGLNHNSKPLQLIIKLAVSFHVT